MQTKNGYHELMLAEELPQRMAVAEMSSGPKGDGIQKEVIKAAVRDILTAVGEDADRQGLLRTPERIAKMYDEILVGYRTDPVKLVNDALFDVEYDEMIVVKDIEFFSMCEHHMLPFVGKAHVAYIPNGYIVGLSKIPRVVDAYARRLQVQERLTTQIKECIQETLNPLGVAVVIEAHHLCMMMRGIQKQNSVTTTSDFTGAFLTDKTRAEFIHLLGSNLH
jgi:GTP cyclohydrolase I